MSRCVAIDVDGDPVLLRVAADLTPEETEALREVMRAARRKFEADTKEHA